MSVSENVGRVRDSLGRLVRAIDEYSDVVDKIMKIDNTWDKIHSALYGISIVKMVTDEEARAIRDFAEMLSKNRAIANLLRIYADNYGGYTIKLREYPGDKIGVKYVDLGSRSVVETQYSTASVSISMPSTAAYVRLVIYLSDPKASSLTLYVTLYGQLTYFDHMLTFFLSRDLVRLVVNAIDSYIRELEEAKPQILDILNKEEKQARNVYAALQALLDAINEVHKKVEAIEVL